MIVPEIIGWIGAVLFCFCGLPQAIKASRTKSTADISMLFLLMWYIGEICTLIYVIYTNHINSHWQWSLLTNYVFNICIVTYIIILKFRYNNERN